MEPETASELSIQRLGAKEWQRLRQIRLKSLKDAPEAFGSMFEETVARPKENWIEQLNTLPTFVAVLHGVDIGIVRCAPCLKQTAIADLISLWVAPNARGLRVGAALIDAVIGWSHSKGYAQLLLEVSDTNSFAIALYEQKGFKVTGVTHRFPPLRQHIQEQEMALDL